jgi:hypothetical protein
MSMTAHGIIFTNPLQALPSERFATGGKLPLAIKPARPKSKPKPSKARRRYYNPADRD